jgi:hypothetical protein
MVQSGLQKRKKGVKRGLNALNASLDDFEHSEGSTICFDFSDDDISPAFQFG